MSSNDFRTLRMALAWPAASERECERDYDALNRIEAEAAAMREALEAVRASVTFDGTGAWFRAAGYLGAVDAPELRRLLDAALSWGGANTGETQAAERKVGK